MPFRAEYVLLAVVLTPAAITGGLALATSVQSAFEELRAAKRELAARAEQDRAREVQIKNLQNELKDTQDQVRQGSEMLRAIASSDQDVAAQLHSDDAVVAQLRSEIAGLGSLRNGGSGGAGKISEDSSSPSGDSSATATPKAEAPADAAPPVGDAFDQAAKDAGWEVIHRPGGTILRASSDTLFAPDHRSLRRAGSDSLRSLATLMAPGAWSGSVEVSGYTDSSSPAGFSSNWALSASEAAQVAEGLVSDGIPARELSIRGFGATQPVAPDDQADGRAKNRRIEIALLRGRPDASK